MKIDEINNKINLLRSEIPSASQERLTEIIKELKSLNIELFKAISIR